MSATAGKVGRAVARNSCWGILMMCTLRARHTPWCTRGWTARAGDGRRYRMHVGARESLASGGGGVAATRRRGNIYGYTRRPDAGISGKSPHKKVNGAQLAQLRCDSLLTSRCAPPPPHTLPPPPAPRTALPPPPRYPPRLPRPLPHLPPYTPARSRTRSTISSLEEDTLTSYTLARRYVSQLVCASSSSSSSGFEGSSLRL